MVYLVKDGGNVRVFYSENDMKVAGFNEAKLTVSEEIFNSNGCYTRIIDGEIVVGKTATEQQIEGLRGQIADIDGQLAGLDQEYLTPRVLCGVGMGDAYALGRAQAHETAAAPLRAEREPLQQSLDQLLG
jgi:hypothetical protein